MEIITGTFEIQFDLKPTGAVIRINDENSNCILRICQIPKNLVFKPDSTVKEFIDVVAKQL
jgi:hypothetical protein